MLTFFPYDRKPYERPPLMPVIELLPKWHQHSSVSKFGGLAFLGGSRPPDPRGGRAGDGNNNAGAAFGGAPAALRAAGGVAPVPGLAPPGVCGAGAPQEGQPPKFVFPPTLVA